ncbi:hypothetical protein ACE15N_21900 (plasmid) [Xanthomonas campestris pv. passiflorae]
MGRRAKKPPKLWDNDDLAFAFNSAADFLEMEEWPEDDCGRQVAAYKEAARRIRRMADRLYIQPSKWTLAPNKLDEAISQTGQRRWSTTPIQSHHEVPATFWRSP